MSYWSFVRPDTEVEDIEYDYRDSGQTMFAIVNFDNKYEGYITLDDIKLHPNAKTASDVLKSVGVRNRDVYVYVTDPVGTATRKLRQKKLEFIPVIDYRRNYQGTIDKDST